MIKLFVIEEGRSRGRRIPIDVPKDFSVLCLKKEIAQRMNISIRMKILFGGKILDDDEDLNYYDLEDGDQIMVLNNYEAGGPSLENNNYDTNINAVNKRENIGNTYYYKIKGSTEGTVWGDNIYTDDSNIAKAAVLEGKCNIGQEKIVAIKMIEGKSSYSSSNKNEISSVSYGSWPASYVFTDAR